MMRCRSHLAAWLMLAIGLMAGPAVADCTTPSGVAGRIIYNNTYNQMQFCNGTNWVNMGSSGTVSGIGTLTNGNFCNTDGSVINCTTSAISLSTSATGTLQAAQFPALTGNVTTTAGSLATTIGSGVVTDAMLAGSIAISKLSATGTASSSTYLRGDGAWAMPSGGVTGSGSTGYGAVWSSSSALTYDSAFYVDTTNHRVGIGTTSPGQKLSVAGTIESTSGGIKFPDGTTQTTAVGAGTTLPTCSAGDSLIATASGWACSSSILASCKAILDAGASTGNGTYLIAPAGSPISAYCNMTIDGGGWTLVASYKLSTGVPTSATSVALNSQNYLASAAYTSLNAAATNYLFDTDLSGTYYFKLPKTYAGSANCQNMTSLSPLVSGGVHFWAWTDGGCNISGGDYSGVYYSTSAFNLYNSGASPGSYSTNGTSWTPVPSNSISSQTIGSSNYLNIFIR